MKKILLLLIFSLLPLSTLAQSSNYLVGIPGVTTGAELDFDDYINAVYAMFISIAALLAVVKVIIAGVKYMFSDIVTQKSEAKKDIQGALLGLVIVLAAVLILTVINPNLTNFDLSGVSQTELVERTTATEDVVQRAAERCTDSAVCQYQSCSSADCEDEIADCASRGRIHQQVGDLNLACFGAATDSIVAEETGGGNSAADRFIAENEDFTRVVEIYTINERDQRTNRDLTPGELLTLAGQLPDECELDENGDENGNTYEEFEDTAQGIFVRMCVQ